MNMTNTLYVAVLKKDEIVSHLPCVISCFFSHHICNFMSYQASSFFGGHTCPLTNPLWIYTVKMSCSCLLWRLFSHLHGVVTVYAFLFVIIAGVIIAMLDIVPRPWHLLETAFIWNSVGLHQVLIRDQRLPYSGKFSYGANFRNFCMHLLYTKIRTYEILNLRRIRLYYASQTRMC